MEYFSLNTQLGQGQAQPNLAQPRGKNTNQTIHLLKTQVHNTYYFTHNPNPITQPPLRILILTNS